MFNLIKNHKKKFTLAGFLIAIASVAYAANYHRIPTIDLRIGRGAGENIKLSFNDNSATLPFIQWNDSSGQLEFSNDGSTTLPVGSGGSSSGVNILSNSDFEQGVSVGWTNSGGTLTVESSVPLYGTKSALFNAAANGNTFTSSDYVVPEGLENRACSLNFYYKWESGTLTHLNYVVELDDGTDLTTATDLVPTTGSALQATAAFICPASDSIKLKITATADAAAITLDRMHLGSSVNEILVSDPVEIVAHAHFNSTASCSWTNAGTALDAFGTDADCPAITLDISSPIATVDATDTDLPQIKFSALPAGIYEVKATFTGDQGTGDNTPVWALSDGTSTRGMVQTTFDITNSNSQPVALSAVFSHSGGAKTFTIFGAINSGNILINNSLLVGSANASVLTYTVTRYPSSSTSKVTLETQGWHINAQISGANPDLGVATVLAYTEIVSASLSMALNGTSKDAQFPCSTTNPPTGLTCSAGSESLGVSFIPPYTGEFLVCATFLKASQVDDAVNYTSTFKLQETGLATQTVSQPGFAIAKSHHLGAAANTQTGASHNICDVFSFTSISRKVIRLMYQQNLITGTPDTSVVATDGADSGEGKREVNFKVIPLTQNFPQAIALGGQPTSEARLSSLTDNNGSGSTIVKRFETITATGTDISCVDSSTLGTICTIGKAGVYCVGMNLSAGAGDIPYGPSKNFTGVLTDATELTTASKYTTNGVLGASKTGSGARTGTVSYCGRFSANDIIRFHCDSTGTADTAVAWVSQMYKLEP